MNQATFFVLLSSLFFALGGLFFKIIPWGALAIGSARSILAAICIFLFLKTRKHKFTVNPTVIIASLSISATNILYSLSNKMTTAGNAIVLQFTMPVFVILIMLVCYRRKPTKTELVTCVLVLTGIICFFLDSLTAGNAAGNLIALLSGISYSMTTVLGKRAKTLHDGRMNAALMVIFTAVLFLFVKPVWTVEIPDLRLWIPFLGLALLGTVLPYTFYLKGLDTGIDGGLASVTATLEPVVGTVLGVVILKDTLVWTQVMGIGIVLTGIAVPILVNQQEAAGRCKSALPR